MLKALALASAAAATLITAPAYGADFSFIGTLPDENAVLFFDFSVGSASTVTLRSYSYAGGTNAMGTAISAGGFDPILSLYDVGTGTRIGQNDDGDGVPTDTVSQRAYDVLLTTPLTAGNYRVAVTAFRNFGPDRLSGVFGGDGSFISAGFQRNSAFAFDVLGVDQATGPGAVPEPATWAMMLMGVGMAGYGLRRRKLVNKKVSFA